MITRRTTKKIYVGSVAVGGDAPVSVQSMTNTDTRDVKATIAQIRRLERAGCDIVRVAVPDMAAADALPGIIKRIRIPLIADIHFDYRLALRSMKAGAHGIRINPGNIGTRQRLAAVIREAGERGVAIRVGINAGSLEKDLLRTYGHPTAEALAESALRNISIVAGMGFEQMKISIKSADVLTCVQAYRLVSAQTRFPLHIGITEAGTLMCGTVKSSTGLGILLSEGIGDTMRVSLSANPVEEIRVGLALLQCLGIRRNGVDLISCPTCARAKIDVISLAGRVEKKLSGCRVPLKVAVMGCEVNGPGEAREADIGIAGSRNVGVLFKKGAIVRKCQKERLFNELMKEIKLYIDDHYCPK